MKRIDSVELRKNCLGLGRTGFTLVELLVVIAIIAVLMAILLPALDKAKTQARTSACLAQMKQWCLFFTMYAEDYDGSLMQGFNGLAGGRDNRWVKALGDYYKWDSKITCCPQATKPWYSETFEDMHLEGTHRGSTTAWGYYQLSGWVKPVKGSYGINGWCNDPDPGEGHYPGAEEKWHWRTPNVRMAARVPLLVGAQRYNLWPRPEDHPLAFDGQYWQDDDQHMARTCLNRHEAFVSAVFLDSSARKVGLKELWTLKWHRQFSTTGPWTRTGGVTYDKWPKWMRKFKDY